MRSTHRPDGHLEVEFAFTPVESGLYQVELTFQPDLGTRRGRVIVPELAAVRVPTSLAVGPAGCTGVSRLSTGEFLCVLNDSATVWRAGQQVADFHGTAITAGGDAIWAVSPAGFVVRRDNNGTVTNMSSTGGYTADLGFCEDSSRHGYRFDGRFVQELTPSTSGFDLYSVSRVPNVACWYDSYNRSLVGGMGGGFGGDFAAGLTAEAVWLVTGTAYTRPLQYEQAGTQVVISPSSTFHLELPASGGWTHRAHWPLWEVDGFALAPVLAPSPHWEAWPSPVLGLDDDVVFLPGAALGEVLMVCRPGR